MTSSIDATKPTTGNALTADVRSNFSAAKSEIEALQSTDSTHTADIAAINAEDVRRIVWETSKTTGAITASDGKGYLVDTSGGAFTITLPAHTTGDVVAFVDSDGTFSTNILTIAPDSGDTIMGLAENLTVDTRYAAFGLVSVDGTDWRLL